MKTPSQLFSEYLHYDSLIIMKAHVAMYPIELNGKLIEQSVDVLISFFPPII